MRLGERLRNQKLNIKFTFVIILFTIVPIGIFAGILFYIMEQNVVDENRNYMQYTMERNAEAISTKIHSINMSTQFFLSDASLLSVLRRTQAGEQLSTGEWLSFKSNDISSLERLVNNNPMLYGVRVYAANDKVQEMMPILYGASRMEKQEWAAEEDYFGWHYNFTDNIFSSYMMDQNRRIVSLVTAIDDSDYGRIGMIEAAMTMETMFPSLYEDIENEWSCFLADDGSRYFGDNGEEADEELLDEIIRNNQGGEELFTSM